ncbi:Forkhead box protein D2 [Marasmius sp. AFHP31]|nr:Forkhead box protein D2 [Marasmius sp. AFHP31]
MFQSFNDHSHWNGFESSLQSSKPLNPSLFSPTSTVVATANTDSRGVNRVTKLKGKEDVLRAYHRLPRHLPLSLDGLDDPAPGERPALPLHVLAQLAIWASPEKKLKLRGIVDIIRARFECFKEDDKLAASIRHLLSLHAVFQKLPKEKDSTKKGRTTQSDRGGYWTLDLTQLDKLKRVRKRRSKKARCRQTNDQDDECLTSSSLPQQASSPASQTSSSSSYMPAPSISSETYVQYSPASSLSPTPPESFQGRMKGPSASTQAEETFPPSVSTPNSYSFWPNFSQPFLGFPPFYDSPLPAASSEYTLPATQIVSRVPHNPEGYSSQQVTPFPFRPADYMITGENYGELQSLPSHSNPHFPF